jgi:hypothetical protein
MLALERRPVEPRARAMLLAVRDRAVETLTPAIRDLTPGLTDAQVHQLELATYAIAGADGPFVAKEVGGDSVDLPTLFEMHAAVRYESAVRLVGESK